MELLVLDVHGGTSENDILRVFSKAEDILKSGRCARVFVFLDEVNTCGMIHSRMPCQTPTSISLVHFLYVVAHMGLFTEVIVRRSINGQPLMDGIQVLAALNPYRIRKDRGMETPGLVFQLHGASATPDPMRALVYRVHPVPATLQGFIFDFGSLSADKEKMYIESMARNVLQSGSSEEHEFVAQLIVIAQQFVRTDEGDDSAASLRDVRRCLNLINWFVTNLSTKKEATVSPLAVATVLGIAFTYYYRLSSEQGMLSLIVIHFTFSLSWFHLLARSSFFIALRFKPDWKCKGLRGKLWDKLAGQGAMESILNSIQRKFCENVVVEEGIAMNHALMENLFVVIICILNRIPVFLVGKPGSSKTLTLQVIASNLQGQASLNPFWRKFPAVYLFQYQVCYVLCAISSPIFNLTKLVVLSDVVLAQHPAPVRHGSLVSGACPECHHRVVVG